mgnify:CR=1 FL=1
MQKILQGLLALAALTAVPLARAECVPQRPPAVDCPVDAERTTSAFPPIRVPR